MSIQSGKETPDPFGRSVRKYIPQDRYVDLLDLASKESLVGSARFTETDAKLRMAQLDEIERSCGFVYYGERQWLNRRLQSDSSLSYAKWIESQLKFSEGGEAFSGQRLYRTWWIQNDGNFCVQFPELAHDDSISIDGLTVVILESANELTPDRKIEAFEVIHNIDYLLDICRIHARESTRKLFREYGVELECITLLERNRTDLATIRIDLGFGGEAVFSFLLNRFEFVRQLGLSDADGPDPFSKNIRTYIPWHENLKLQEELERGSLIELQEFSEQQVDLRLQQLTKYENDFHFVYFGEKQWLLQRTIESQSGTALSYSDWVERQWNSMVTSDGFRKETLGGEPIWKGDIADPWMIVAFDELLFPPGLRHFEFSVAVVDPSESPSSRLLIAAFHFLHNFCYLVWLINQNHKQFYDGTPVVNQNDFQQIHLLMVGPEPDRGRLLLSTDEMIPFKGNDFRRD